jgi:xanthine dehydrogenase/oxidase
MPQLLSAAANRQNCFRDAAERGGVLKIERDCKSLTRESGGVEGGAGNVISFVLNGENIFVSDIDPRMLLLDLLRSPEIGLTGTKLSCGEGGCGACTVSLAYLNPETGKVVEGPINACLRPLCSVDGMAVTTTEGIGDYRKINPIQKRIVEHNASQCGFCTPGFVMCMYGMLRSLPNPSNRDVESFFDGNLCRCTGFRPILDAMQSFVGDEQALNGAVGKPYAADRFRPVREFEIGNSHRTWRRVATIERALFSMRPDGGRTVRIINGNTSSGIYKDAWDGTETFLDISQIPDLRRITIDQDRPALRIGSGVTYAELLRKLDEMMPGLPAGSEVGLRALTEHVRRIAGHQVRSVGTVGGNIMLVLSHAESPEPFPSDLFTVLAALDASLILRRPASPMLDETFRILSVPPLREFPDGFLITDVIVPFTSIDCRVRTFKVARRQQNSHAIVNAGLFIRQQDNGVVSQCRLVFGGIQAVAWRATNTEQALVGTVMNGAGLDVALAALTEELGGLTPVDFGDGFSAEYRRNLARNLLYKFLIGVASEAPQANLDPRVASADDRSVRPVSSGRHGTIPAPYLPGAIETQHTLALAVDRVLPADFRSDVRTEAPTVLYETRKWIPSGLPPRRPEATALALADALTLPAGVEAAALPPVPIPKLGADLQATGEAEYTQDIHLAQRPLESQFVLSERSFAKFKYSATTDEILRVLKAEVPGVHSFVTCGDIKNKPLGNTYNSGDPAGYDPIFADLYVTWIGQPIALVLADSALAAGEAAVRAQSFIEYDTGGLTPPIMTIDEAIDRNSYLPSGTFISRVQRPGSEDQWLDKPYQEDGNILVHGSQSTGAQAHFYFETQSTLAVPGEADRITIYCSSQNVGSCQRQVAAALGIANSKVDAKALRLGGGFGGKELRASYFSVAAAVAAVKSRRAVRIALDRTTDMKMVGKRHPFLGNFWISADKKGKIGKVKYEFFADAGGSYDCTLPVTDLVLLSADSAYGIANFRAERQACRTNTLTNTAMRSFGVIQSTLIVEASIEKLAHSIGISPETVRECNFYRDATAAGCDSTPYGQRLMDCRINQVWSDFKKIVSFEDRKAAINEFNRANRWRKRGISMIPIKYGVSYTNMTSNQSGADVVVFSNDGTVLIKHGGMEMGQGIHTKIARLAADTLGIDIGFIEVGGTDTQDVANAPSTGASTGTDLNGGAVRDACIALRERLKKFCADSKAVPGWETEWNGNWKKIVSAAYRARVQLSSQALFKSPHLSALTNGQLPVPQTEEPDPRVFYYFTYSVGAAEVEIDVLTGEHTIMRADIVYDCGKTINAALDYGQVEGGFIQGVGNVTCEEIYHAPNGQLLSSGTWNYKIPCSLSIPIEFNVYLLDYIPTPDAKTPLDTYGIHSAKSTGEPPLVLSTSVFYAIKQAIGAARLEEGSTDWFDLQSPATVERIQSACRVG